MDSPVYRVVLTGELVSGFSREAVIAALARFFRVSAARLVNVFEGGDFPIDDLLSADRALTLQRDFERMGARARVDRVAADAVAMPGGIALPQQQDPSAAGLMRCPACGHEQLVADSCDECGVVFSQFNRGRAATGAAGAGPQLGPTPSPQPYQPATAPSRNHASASDSWRDEWVDDDGIPTEDYHVGLFMGVGSAELSEGCQRMMVGQRTPLRPSWLTNAVFSPYLWAMYRKMWLWAIVIFITEVLLPVVLITLGAKPNISDFYAYAGLALLVLSRLVWPALLKWLYCRHARRTIAAMHRVSPTYAPDIDIATRGGTSRTAVIVGVVVAIVLSLLTWNITDSVYDALVRPTPLYIDVPATTEFVPLVVKPDAPAARTAQDDLLVNENRWVATRNRLRTIGQRLDAWLSDGAASIDHTNLTFADIAQALNLDQEELRDGWGNAIEYQAKGQRYRLVSAGPDGVLGNEDDVAYRRTLKR